MSAGSGEQGSEDERVELDDLESGRSDARAARSAVHGPGGDGAVPADVQSIGSPGGEHSGTGEAGDRPRWSSALLAWVDDVFGLDLRTLALVRIGLAVALLGSLASLWMDAGAFYTDAGILPRQAWLERSSNPWMFSLHLLGGQAGWMHVMLAVQAVLGGMLLVGWRTRWATVLSWLLYLSLVNRNAMVSQAGDSLLLLMLLWGVFVPWGGRFSVDAALDTRRARRPVRVVSVATLALLLQMPLTYAFSAVVKLGNPSWWPDLLAVGYALHPEFVTPLGRWVSSVLPLAAVRGLTLFTVGVELLAPALVLLPGMLLLDRERRRWVLAGSRLLALGLLTLLQFGLLVTLQVGWFPVVSTAALLVCVDGRWWDRLALRGAARRAAGLTLYHDADCGFCRKGTQLLREFLLPAVAGVRPSTADPEVDALVQREWSWVVEDADGARHLRFDGIVAVVRHSPWAWWLVPVLLWRPVHWLGDRAYRLVADNRGFFARFTEPLVERPYPVRTPVVLQGVVLLLVLYAPFSFAWGIDALRLPEPVRQVQTAFRFGQSWKMFRTPVKWESHLVIDATLSDGRRVDLYGGRGRIDAGSAKALTWSPPERGEARAHWASYRWRRYLTSYRNRDHREARLHYGRYVCRRWNGLHEGEDRLDRFRVYRVVMRRDVLGGAREVEGDRQLLWRHWCFGRPADDDEPGRMREAPEEESSAEST
ncbi:MAG: DUF393 domain-containing protein [Deltaproteobacteria bacterium]|nr:MAG: DUF393 domain-containing protein [Deltaproteobacteria bacterium]